MKTAGPAGYVHTDTPQEKPAEQAPEDADHDVENDTHPRVSSHDFAADPASQTTDDDPADDTQSEHFRSFRLTAAPIGRLTRVQLTGGVASDTSRTRFVRRRDREEPTNRSTSREGNTMVDINGGLAEAVKGVVEDVKGKAKVVIGAVTGRDDLFNEGKAQQDKAQAQRNAAKKEAEAEAARAAAKVAEKRQKAEQ
jgi:uncharacterized protein YjbJ (UPF0337 family)